MPTPDWKRRIVPLGLGLAMLATVIAAALTPNFDTASATPTAQYGTPTGTTTPFPWWIVAVIVVVVAAIVLAYLMLGRRRRPPARGAPPPPGGAPPSGAATGAPPPGPSAAYLETPEDVGAAMPAVAGLGAAGGAGAAAGAATQEPDIDALMAELDKISGEILKKPPKTGQTGGGSTDTQGTQDSSQ
jgi:hypothetical protein